MLKLEIRTYEGVGPIVFGMTREQVRAVLGKPTTTFKKGQIEPNDAYKAYDIHIAYDPNGRVDSVEAFTNSRIEWRGKRLFELSYMQLYDLLTEGQSEFTFDDDGLNSLAYGIGVWAPFDDDEEEREVKSILVFRRGYWG